MTLCLYFTGRVSPVRLDVKDQQEANNKLKDLLANGVWLNSVFYPPHSLDRAEVCK